MRSKMIRCTVFTALVGTVQACSAATDKKSDDYLIGRRPETFSAAYLWQAGDANALAVVQPKGHTLQEFSLEPFAHQRSLPLPLADEKPGVLASADGGYYLVTSNTEYAVLKADGSKIEAPEELPGGVQAVAFAPAQNLAVLTDDFHTMVLLALDQSGNIVGHLKKGSLIGGKNADSGTMLEDGRLVLALDGKSIAVVQTAATITAGDWQSTSFDVADATSLSWIASVPGQPDLVLALDDKRLLSLNVATGAVVDQKDLTTFDVLMKSRDYAPHVVAHDNAAAVDDGTVDVYYAGADGKIATAHLRGSSDNVTQTLFDPASGVMTLVYGGGDWSMDEVFTKQSIYRFRMSDNLALDVSAINDDVNLVVTPSYLFALYPSSLGKAARYTYGSKPDVQVTEGYDLETYIGK